MNVLLFQTDIERSQLSLITKLMEDLENIERWTIDFDDSDRVLRIVSKTLTRLEVQVLLAENGFVIKELTS